MPRIRKFIDPLLLTCQSILVFLAFYTLSPKYQVVPHRDSGIFLYIGSELLRGKVLYQQTWDNKQPLLYWLNAIGLWLGGGSPWGVWALELGFYLIGLFLLYLLLRKALAPLPSFFTTVISFLTIYQIMSGNFSEEYAIFFQICLLALLFFVYLPNQCRLSRPLAALGMGLITGLVFCIKQTYIDVSIAIVIFMLFLAWLEKKSGSLIHLLWFALGFLLVNLGVFLYFILHGAFNDYLISAFLIYRYYSSQGPLEWLQSILGVFKFTAAYPFLLLMSGIWLASVLAILIKYWKFIRRIFYKPAFKWISLAVALAGVALFLFAQVRGKAAGIGLMEWSVLAVGILFTVITIWSFTRKVSPAFEGGSLRGNLSKLGWLHPGTASLLFLGIIDLPIVVFAISLSGLNFPHYYISLFSPLFLLLAAGVNFLSSFLRQRSPTAVSVCFFAAIILAGSFSPVLQVVKRLQFPGGGDARSETAAYLKSATTPNDKILVWGWESVIYFLSERESPSRYAFQFPAYLVSPYQPGVQETLLQDIQAKRPVYIADTNDPEMPFIQGEKTTACLSTNPADGNKLQQILNFVCTNYHFEKSIDTIDLYRLNQ